MPNQMNLTEKLLSGEVIKRIKAIDFNSGSSDIGPYVVELDPTAACDLACPGCISEDVISEGGRFSNERLIGLGHELIDAGVRGVILIGGGEPLLHSKIGDFMALMYENDVHIGITTNVPIIDKYIEIIAKASSWTRVSMDAGTAQKFNILRPSKSNVNKFSHIIRNMESLAKVKRGKLGYSYLLQSEQDGPGVVSNAEDLLAGARLAKEIGCDYFEVKPSYNFRDDVAHSLKVHDEEFLSECKNALDSLADLETESFKIIHAINLAASLEGVQIAQLKS